MKKIALILLSFVIVVALSSCASTFKTNGYVRSAQTHGYYSLFDVSFGIPIEEFKEVLNDYEITMVEKTQSSDAYNDEEVQIFTVDLELFEKEATAYFFFHELMNDGNAVLCEIRIEFKEDLTIKQIISELQKDFEQKNLSYEIKGDIGDSLNYQNNNTLSSIKNEDIKKKAIDLIDKHRNPYNLQIEEFPLDNIMLFSIDGVKLDAIILKGSMAAFVGISENQEVE